jgi:CheY-like chemotaxis protein
MNNEVVILMAEDDPGHAELIRRNLERGGIVNRILHFNDGQEIIDYLYKRGDGPVRQSGASYVLLLDIRMPKLDGLEVLAQMKTDPELRKIPVTMITTSNDPRDVERCYALGCSSYIVKPSAFDGFIHAIRHLGLFLAVMEVPRTGGEN